MLDPLWLVNCSERDIVTLFNAPFHFKHGSHDASTTFKDLASHFRAVVKLCLAMGIHSGCNWADARDLYHGMTLLAEKRQVKDEELRLAEEERLRRVPKSVVIRASDNVADEGPSGTTRG